MRVFYFIILSQIFISCKLRTADNLSQFKILSDTTKYSQAELNHYQKLTDALLLSRIDSGVDSLELRIWTKSAMINLRQVTILNFKDSTWHLSRTTFWSDPFWNFEHNPIAIDSSETKWLTPNIPFYTILDTIKKYKLDTIPTQTQTPNFEDRTADGTSYFIELATSRYYKSLSYRNPKFYKELNHQKINAFLSFCFEILGVWPY